MKTRKKSNWKRYAYWIFMGCLLLLWRFDYEYTYCEITDGTEVCYTQYLLDNRYCNWKTKGHCPNSSFIRHNAYVDALRSSCERYKRNQNQMDRRFIMGSMDYGTRMDKYEKLMGDKELKIDSIVHYKDLIFSHWHIE